jgi:hypothetical protein
VCSQQQAAVACCMMQWLRPLSSAQPASHGNGPMLVSASRLQPAAAVAAVVVASAVGSYASLPALVKLSCFLLGGVVS